MNIIDLKANSEDEAAVTLQQYVESGEPIVLDFYAPWCAPCAMLLTMFDEFGGNDTTLIKINAEQYPSIAAKYRVRGIPALFFYNSKGDVMSSHIGAMNKTMFSEKLAEINA